MLRDRSRRLRLRHRGLFGSLVFFLVASAISSGTTLGQPYRQMDYGPFMTTTLEVSRGNVANKAIIVRLDGGSGGVSQGNVFVAFDTDTMRCAAGWTGEVMDWKSVVYDGSHNTHPSLVGNRVFLTPMAPGWANPADGSFLDPRIRGKDGRAYGPLPHAWGKWNGLYRHGQQVVFSYDVGTTRVLESPRPSAVNGPVQLVRQLNLGPRSRELVLQAAGEHGYSATLRSVTLAGKTRQVALLMAPETSGGPDLVRSSYEFSGGQYVRIERSETLHRSDGDFSVVARLKTGQGGTIWANAPGGKDWAPNGKTFFVRRGRLCYDVGWVGAVQSNRNVADGKWHTVAVTHRSESADTRLYIDGKLEGQATLRPEGPTPDGEIRIGYTSANFPREQSKLLGSLQWLTYYDRPLSAEALSDPGTQPEGEAGSWDFSRTIRENRVPDRSGNGHHGTLISDGSASPFVGVAVIAVGDETADWEVTDEGNLRLHFPAGDDPMRVAIKYVPLPNHDHWLDQVQAAEWPDPVDLHALTAGAPPLWPQELKTQVGRLGATDGPFQIEELTIPSDNPWHSWIRLGGVDFFSDGDRGALCSWQGDVWTVRGLSDPNGQLRWRRIASGLFQPLGLKIVEDRIYVLGRDQISRLHDLNGDGETDFYENFNNDAQVTDHFHEFAMDLQTDAQGNFIYSKGARHALPALVPQHGTLIKVTPDGSRSEIVARGFRAPDGVLVNDDGSYFVSDQEGHWTPMNRINWVRAGGYYGNMMAYNPDQVAPDEADPPVVWVHRELDRSPTAQVWVRSKQWESLNGSLLSLSYGTGKTWRVLRQQVGDVMQGGIVQLPIPEFPTGIQRGRFHPDDGMLYVCGLFGWSSDKTLAGGFYRVRYTGKPLYVPDQLQVSDQGVLIHFPFPVDHETAGDARNFVASRWNYHRTANYGSDDYRVSDDKPGRDAVSISAVSVASDRKSVFLHIPDMVPCMQMRIRYRFKAMDGAVVTSLIDHTIHTLPDLSAGLRERFEDRLDSDLAVRRRRTTAPDAPPEVQPGLVLTLQSDFADREQQDVRIARLLALRVDPRSDPSVFVGRGPFVAQWEGYLQRDLPDEVVFEAEVLGQFSLAINGIEVLQASTDRPRQVTSRPVALTAGLNALSARLGSLPNGRANLRVQWQPSGMVAESIRPSAFAHSHQQADRLGDLAAERDGRRWFADFHCQRCHAVSPGAKGKRNMPELNWDPPSLAVAGKRWRAQWLYRWMLDPNAVRNQATMPKMFDQSPSSLRDAADITAYLESLGQTDRAAHRPADQKRKPPSAERIQAGLALYEDLGCIACHHLESPDWDDYYGRISLRHCISKFQAGQLVEYLLKPHAYYASRPMPDFQLSRNEADSLAAYLSGTIEPEETFVAPVGDVDRGKEAFKTRGCAACHRVVDADPLPVALQRNVFLATERDGGCLGNGSPAQVGRPDYGMTPKQRDSLASFLDGGENSLSRHVPAEAAARAFDRLRCSRCHRRDGALPDWPEVLGEEGERGLTPEIVPPLTWTGEKLHEDWTERRLAGKISYVPRPWLRSRMPSFPAYAKLLAEGLAAQHAVAPEPRMSDPNPEQVSLGQTLVGKEKGFYCLQCHALPETPPEAPFESRGVDFVRVRDRLRPSYFHRWLGNPPQFDVMAKMPRFSPDGKTTPVADVLGGNAAAQFEAIWAYLNSLPFNANHP